MTCGRKKRATGVRWCDGPAYKPLSPTKNHSGARSTTTRFDDGPKRRNNNKHLRNHLLFTYDRASYTYIYIPSPRGITSSRIDV